jgi:hypothetical protein
VAVKRAASPYRVGGLATEHKAVEIVECVLAAWGLPSLDASRPHGAASVVEQLADAGEYVAEAPEYRVKVQRVTR